ncbi:MAG: hypothetical protein QOJ54_1065 [Aliidongia sp.]|nr:hypothetical protein [Aliidongia sp.]
MLFREYGRWRARYPVTRFRRIAHLVLIVLVLLAVTGNCLSAGIWTRHFQLTGPYLPESGLAWTVPQGEIVPPVPWLLTIDSDTLSNPHGAEYSVNDEAGPLGPAHAPHAEIREFGAGRYSFWDGQVRFSTGLGDDPNATHRQLTITGVVMLARPFGIILDFFGAIAAFLLFIELRRIIEASPFLAPIRKQIRESMIGRWLPAPSLTVIGLFVGIFDVTVLYRLPHTIFYTPDSDGYYNFMDLRTAGYGLLLHGFEFIFGDPYAIVVFQFIMSAAATLFLCAAARRFFRSSLLAMLLGIVLTLKQGLIHLHFFIMPDSLFFSCATAELGLALLLLERASIRRLGAAGVVMAAAMALRPAAIGLLPGLGIVALLVWRRHPARAACLAGLLAASIFANMLIQPMAALLTGRPDAGAGKFSGFVLIGSAGFLLTPDTPTSQPELRDRLVAALAPIRAAWIAAQTIEERRGVIIRTQDDVIYRHAQPIACNPPPLDCTRAAVNETLRRLSVDAILDDPYGMMTEFIARLTEDMPNTLAGDWEVSQENSLRVARDSMNGSTTGRLWLSSHRYDLTPRGDDVAPDPFGIGAWLFHHRVAINFTLLAGVMTSTGWFMVAMLRRRLGTELGAIGVSAMGFLGYHIFVCLLQVPVARYSDPLTAWLLIDIGGCFLLVIRGLSRTGWFGLRIPTRTGQCNT